MLTKFERIAHAVAEHDEEAALWLLDQFKDNPPTGDTDLMELIFWGQTPQGSRFWAHMHLLLSNEEWY